MRRLVAGFCVGEAAVAEHLRPFAAAADDPTLAACLRAQGADEDRHARFFARVAREVVGLDPGREASQVAGPELGALFGRLLPQAAAAVAGDATRLPDGVALYHLVLEGVVFAVGQELLVEALEAAGTLPVTLDGARRVQADERWHVGLGVQCLARSGSALPLLDEPLALAAAAWGDAGGGACALERHRRRIALLV